MNIRTNSLSKSLLVIAACIVFPGTNVGFANAQQSTNHPTSSETKATMPDPSKPDYATNPKEEWERPFDSFKFNVYKKGDHQLPYRLHSPSGLERGTKYPLVLFMHGNGERGLDNRGQFLRFACFKFWEKYPCYVLAPQCPPKADNIPNSQLVWVDTPYGAPEHTMKASPTWPMDLTIELLNKVIRENKIDCDRVYVTGLSMGGFATWELIQRFPGKFAAAIPVCGGGDVAFASQLTNLPLWAFHGGADRTVPVERSRNMVEKIKQAGGHPLYTEYPNVDHDSWGRTYANPEVWDWLFNQSKSKK
ncbi:MAG: prolyl oligopeptidase family serine peptidase [Bacteroidota bacterium]|nr:prolyl oligopeptidase family serine peptidase [Bacteroidota bacterium]